MTNNPEVHSQNDDQIINSTIERARALRHDDQLEASQELLLDLLKEYPDHPLVLFEVGGSYDVLGEEEMAIPYYREAVDAGLDGNDLQECLVCLGSTLRLMGEYDEAEAYLNEAIEQFPDNNSSRVFLALVHYSQGQPERAISDLMSLLLETTSDEDILTYADALDYYKDNLDETLD